MTELSNADLIARAKAVVNPRRIGDYLVGDVGAALITDQGHIYVGVCIDAGSGIGFCAEHSAIAAMVTAGETRIERIVAVWLDETGAAYVIPPCGRCRELIRQIQAGRVDTLVILAADHAVPLAELLPYHDGWNKIEPL